MSLISKSEDRAIEKRRAEKDASRIKLESLALRLKLSGIDDAEIVKQVGHKVFWGISCNTGLITSAHIII